MCTVCVQLVVRCTVVSVQMYVMSLLLLLHLVLMVVEDRHGLVNLALE